MAIIRAQSSEPVVNDPLKEKTVILVVDDDPINLNMLSRRLERSGYSTLVAESGVAAMQIIDQEKIDLVLLDQMMPGMNGTDVLRHLRSRQSSDQLPVLMVTALSQSDNIVDALALGANDYITKPIDMPVVLARIKLQLDRKRVSDKLRKSEERYALATRGTNDGLFDWDIQSRTVYYSPRWKSMLGIPESEDLQSPEDWLSLVHPQDRTYLEAKLECCWSPGSDNEFESEHRIRHRNGLYRWVLSRGVVLMGPDGNAIRMAGSLTDITQHKAYDPLTGLPNREMFLQRLEMNLEQMQGNPKYLFAIMFLDLDRFKIINDSMGHDIGDQLLIGLARRLMHCVRSGESPDGSRSQDMVARIGGDKFVILVSDLPHYETTPLIAKRILSEIHKPFNINGRDIYANLSIGIALASSDYKNPGEILRDADTAMYRAKAEGRACWALFDANMRQEAVERHEIESDLRTAMEKDELQVYYQPKVNIQSGALVGFEALMRWHHPTKGSISPTRFIPLAEETGLIVPFGLWVLKVACTKLREWNLKYSANTSLEVSVNLSVRQFIQPDLVEQIARILKESRISPACIQLEITESVLMGNFDSALKILHQLKALGVGLKVDDFGTGYSSLSYLTQLPLDCLKIDRSFVSRMCHDSASAEVVKAVVELAKNLGMKVVAEGVEDSMQELKLKEMGCEFGQGYFYAKPLPPDAAEEYLAVHLIHA